MKTKQKITIAFINPFYKPCIGGAEISLEKIMRGLKNSKKTKVFLITSNVNSKGDFLKSKQLVKNNVTKIGLSRNIKITNATEWKKQVIEKHYQALNSVLPKVDIVYFNYTLYLKNLNAFEVIASKGKPIIIKIIYTKAITDIKSSLEHLLKYNNIYFHCISKEISRELIKIGIPRKRLFICPNPVDTKFFYIKKPTNIISMEKNFIYTGRLSPQKNIPGLVELFSRIQFYNNKASMTIIGRVTHPEMIAIVRELKRKYPKIKWLDEIPNKKIGDYLRRADIFMIASKDEGMSNSLLEAMSCGLCPIAPANISGMKDLITNNKNGFLYDENNVNSFAKKIADLTAAEANAFGLAARNTVEELCSISKVIKKHLKFYSKVCA
ncbi:MAG: glycosyltransferase family 4 protein [Patescibacteria group bacterium]